MRQKSNTKSALLYENKLREILSVRLEDNGEVRFAMSSYEQLFSIAQAEKIADKIKGWAAQAAGKEAANVG